MTDVGFGRMHALGPKWVAGYGPWRKWALLCEEGSKKESESRHCQLTCWATERWEWHGGAAGSLEAQHLLGELSAGSLADPEGSKCSCWPGNLRRSISHSSCSWSPPRCCNLVPFRRLRGDLLWCSLFLEGLADSASWPEGRTMSLSVTAATDTDDELASDLSILKRNNEKDICWNSSTILPRNKRNNV